ncbi:MAG: RNA polymerase sigma factor [Kiritimatiellae bacterium]|nr:RNA polymerase sigma factor [Kiritimatiellia bacterium]
MSQRDSILGEARRFEKNLLNFFWRQGVSPSEGEDLVQETYLRLWKYRDRYVPTAKLSTFLFTLARQVRIDNLRRRVRRQEREELYWKDSVEPPPSPNGGADARWDARWALSKLSEPLRDVVELGLMQDLPYAEVAEILGIPVGTVKSRMSNALKKLKEVFDDEGS